MLKPQARRNAGLPLDERQLNTLCDDFERLPLHFMRFHAATDVDDVIDAMEFAAYVHDVEHVVLDNLQFMTPAGGAGRSFDKWAAQDAAVAKFRANREARARFMIQDFLYESKKSGKFAIKKMQKNSRGLPRGVY